ncbi:MAG: tRNA (adenosine(37)-N6)-dimethylallyltransferase MiaA [Desulfovibrio sp.]|nr:tRNA (adenosine(37)-N6)-dimethylallyltransferase MiaA [Desulfovibrio sp.]
MNARQTAPLPVICLAGPTGSGKTVTALALAERLNGEVVNADSRQVYADFPCITAQPTGLEQAQCPHHLYGFLPCTQKINAGRWVDQATQVVRHILHRGKTPLLVGGTGFYFHALLHGMAAIPAIDPTLTAHLTERALSEGIPQLHAELANVDPTYAAKIHPNDRQRIVRALEVFLGTGHTLSWWHTNAAEPPLCTGPLLLLDATLAWLEPRLARRQQIMLAAGALDEARTAFEHCSDASAPGWSGIGCAEMLAFLCGSIDWQTCLNLWLHNTRAYAKRQLTWFHARPEAVRLPPDAIEIALRTAEKHWRSIAP